MKENFIQVTIGGKPFSLTASHPTFKRMKTAIQKKNWAVVPKLVNMASQLTTEAYGVVEVRGSDVYYKDKVVHSSLTNRIIEMLNESRPISHMLKFMDNLYENPAPEAIEEFFNWLTSNQLPITDDGEFLAYKSVDNKYKDQHTHTIDNSPGQVIMMSRNSADKSWRTQCSSGFHICSKQYGLYGTKVMAVKANPRDVLSATDGKMRVTKYEVLMELGEKDRDLFEKEGFSQLEKKLVVEVKKERKEMLDAILALPDVKRKIRNKKLSKLSLLKASFARVKTMFQKYGLVPTAKVGPEDNEFLMKARKAGGFTIGQVAKKLGKGYKSIVSLEKREKPSQKDVDSYLEAIARLSGVSMSRSAVSYPKPVSK